MSTFNGTSRWKFAVPLAVLAVSSFGPAPAASAADAPTTSQVAAAEAPSSGEDKGSNPLLDLLPLPEQKPPKEAKAPVSGEDKGSNPLLDLLPLPEQKPPKA